MKIKIHRTSAFLAFAAAIFTASASAQAVLFDFNNAPDHTPFPIDLTVGGITAHFSGTGQGYSIQDTSAPVVPAGFSGRFIYPSSIYQADLLISFDQTLTDFSILYSPQELACDDSATMRVTANMNGVFVGTNTMTAHNPGTWPVDTLRCSFPQGFNSVVVHYDSRPPTCTDYGVIFLADDMRVTAATSGVTAFCFGDVSCPCANAGGPGNGCANSVNSNGANLAATGTASITSDTLALVGTGMPNSSAMYFQGTTRAGGGFGTPFGDGLRCAGGSETRLGIKTNTGGASQYPIGGDLHVSVKGADASGSVRTYQCWYRNAASFCTVSTFNLSNGVEIAWAP